MLEGIRRLFGELIKELGTRTLSEKEIQEHVEDFKFQLVANDVALEVAEKLGEMLEDKLRELRLRRFENPFSEIKNIMINIVDEILKEGDLKEVLNKIDEKRGRGEPFVVLFVGPNGSGKTTTIAKIANYLKKLGYPSIIAAADTFRAGAIEQIQKLAKSVKVRVVSQRYGADPAAVAMDAVVSATTNNIPVVLIDTAGRSEVDQNLLEEMRKIKRVVSPDLVIYVGDALAGNAAVEQAKRFDEFVGIDYVVLAKLDADARGGSAISISQLTGRPILFVGVGQGLDDLRLFSKELIKSILFSS
ncbi:MAG: signal recognition particle-docking protein FtsY [Nitrososphaeria archaeon]|nr:signal recognition particle-docking protein FtsY [Nitrososphaeria archaeon]